MTRLDSNEFGKSLALGVCDPPLYLTPLVKVSQRALHDLECMQVKQKVKSFKEHEESVRKRMDFKPYAELRAAVNCAIMAADHYFPAYKKFAGEFLNDEWLSCVDWHKNFHRDHVSHQLMSVYVGNTLLSGAGGNIEFGGRPLIDWCVEMIIRSPECAYLREYLVTMGASRCYLNDTAFSRCMWRYIFQESFFLAAMYHDCGYPWQFVSNIENALRAHHPIQSPLDRGAEWTFDNYKGRLIMYPLNGYQPLTPTQPANWTENCKRALQTGLTSTHGMPGAFTLIYLNDLLRDYPRRSQANPIQRFCIEWAAMAIMMHDLEPLYSGEKGGYAHSQLRVSLKRDPLSFILTLTDQIQDFDRPNAVFDKKDSGKVEISYKSLCHAVELEQSGRELNILFCYRNKGDAAMNADVHKPEAMKQYFAKDTGYLDYSDLPLSAIKLDAKVEGA